MPTETLRLRQADESAELLTANQAPTDLTELQPFLIGARQAAKRCGISVASWERLHAAGKVPAPVRLGGRVLWRVDELRLGLTPASQVGANGRHGMAALNGLRASMRSSERKLEVFVRRTTWGACLRFRERVGARKEGEPTTSPIAR
jgi:hypothetical protein